MSPSAKSQDGAPDESQPSGSTVSPPMDGQTVATWAAAEDGKSCHPNDIPQPASLVLAGHVRRHGDVFIKNGAGQKQRVFDSGFLRGFGDFNLHAVGDGLRSGVGINDGAEW